MNKYKCSLIRKEKSFFIIGINSWDDFTVSSSLGSSAYNPYYSISGSGIMELGREQLWHGSNKTSGTWGYHQNVREILLKIKMKSMNLTFYIF